MAGEIKHKWNGTILTITSDSGTSSCDLKGAQGDDGVRGPQGPSGLILDESGNVLYEGYATEAYVDERLEDIEIEATVDLSNYYTRDEIDATIAELQLSGGGGGGGGSTNNAVLTLTNEADWLSKAIAEGVDCYAEVSWSSIENGQPTGNGAVTVHVGGVQKYSKTVAQGKVSINIAPFLSLGNNSVRVSISDAYGNTRSIIYNVNVVALTITSTFDANTANEGDITFTYTPYGSLDKVVYFILDGEEIGTQEVSTSGRSKTFIIPAQKHGSHKLEVYFEATIDGVIVPSNTLHYDLICVEAGKTTPIIASAFNTTQITQFETVNIYYSVYNPSALTAEVVLKANGVAVNELVVDRTQQLWSYRADSEGELVLTIHCGNQVKTFAIDVAKSDMDVEATTDNLDLYLSSYGRNNSEANPGTWVYGDIKCSFQGHNWRSDGWLPDDKGYTVHRLTGNARLTIPLEVFKSDARETGKTIEIEFSTRNTLDYDAVIGSCFNNNIGFKMTAQKATIKSEQTEISTQYKENEHIRLTFVIEKRAENRLVYAYLNGIMCGVVQYPDGDNFSQSSPVALTFGSNLATIDIYSIRVYSNSLTRYQVLDNWIADTLDINERYKRYTRNNIFNAYGDIVIENLPEELPYLIFENDTLPTYKGNEVSVKGRYVDPTDESNNFTFVGATADVQGTSSAEYARKNYIVTYGNGITQNGQPSSTYKLREDSIPTNTFTYKADVASSEGANNVELVRLYNELSPFKTPPQLANPNVRQGIDGFPIVIFHKDQFIGKYNFNNDKKTPEVFGFQNGDESWEIKNNTSNRVLWKSADFSGTDWKNDFEARFPKDNEAVERLAAFAAWVASTDQTAATNATLDEPVTYGETTFAADTKEYRLAKFKAEIEDHAELQSALFYYLFTELFLMVDSRAKNAFPTWYGDGKVCWLPYDMDTALGINNEGALVFGYELEDIDTTETGADVYNGQQSVFWINLRQAFGEELKTMYQNLRSAENGLSYELVERMFEEHQKIWPEAIWNEDAWFKYLQPLVEDNTASYLTMLQGSKEEQRKWWLYNRFRYIDSKYNAGDAKKDVITLRGYEKDNITVEPYADIYATIKYGSYDVQKRALRGQTYTLECPLDTLNDTEIYIYSASQLKSIGDVSGLKVGYADYSMATRLQDLRVGSAAEGYQNLNLEELYLGNNVLLGTLDARNCPNLKQSINLSKCVNLEYVYFDGTAISGVSLPDGGILKVLHLPSTITNLTLKNQMYLTDLTIPSYSNITTLRLENVGDKVDIDAILRDMAAGSRVRLIGLDWHFDSLDKLTSFYDLLDTMTGLDEYDNNMEKAQVSGRIHVPSIRSDALKAYTDRYPNIQITADEMFYHVKYQNYNSVILYDYWALAGSTAIDPIAEDIIEIPVKPSNGYDSFFYDGWSSLPVVTGDITVTALYISTPRTYSVRFLNTDGTVLETVTANYLEDISYTGTTPKQPDSASDYTKFAGWYPQPINVAADMDCVALYRKPNPSSRFFEDDGVEITDSWTDIIASIRDGSYATKYGVGYYKPLTIGDKTYNMYIIDMYKDTLANDTGKATITWFSFEERVITCPYYSGEYSSGGWKGSYIRAQLADTVYPQIPEEVRNAIVEVVKSGVNDKVWAIARDEYSLIDMISFAEPGGIPGYSNSMSTSGYYGWTRDMYSVYQYLPANTWNSASAYSWRSPSSSKELGVKIGFCM